jgi:formate dehydrogenase subunit gamma
MRSNKSYKTRIGGDETSSASKILRFRRSERLVHWALAVPFLVCFGTALVLVFYYNPDPLRPYRTVFSWIHRISGICLIILPMLAIIKSRGDFKIYFYNIRQAWVWSYDDLKWLFLMGLAAVNKNIKLPEQGKFNAAEKLNFMKLMSTYPLYIMTGLIIWLTNAAFLSWAIHFIMAVIATPLVVGHLYMAIINPESRKGLNGMISGVVDRQWAKHHYGKWYREHYEDCEAPVISSVSHNQDSTSYPDTEEEKLRLGLKPSRDSFKNENEEHVPVSK